MASSGQAFREVRRLPLRRTAFVLAIPPTVMLALLVWQVVLGHAWGKQPMSNSGIIGWTVFLWIVYLRLVTVRLVTEARGREFVVAMRGLWRSRRVPAAEISSVETVTYDPESDYGGYGIRANREGKAYLAAGNRGVRLRLSDGSTLVVSSQRPEELAEALKGLASRI